MSISMYEASVPVFTNALGNLSAVLKKGAQHAIAHGVDPNQLLQQRLIFDMLPLVKQVQIACDTATRSTARMAGTEPKSFPDTETTMAQLQERIGAAIAYLETFEADQIDGCESHDIIHKTRAGEQHYEGLAYLREYALPNFFFHCTTTYAILRVAGADVGKRDYLGLN